MSMKQAPEKKAKQALPLELAPLNNKANQSKQAKEKAMAAYQKKVAEYEALYEKGADKIQVLRGLAAMQIGKLTYKIKKTEHKLAKSELKLAKKAQNKIAPVSEEVKPSPGKSNGKRAKTEVKPAKKASNKPSPAVDQTDHQEKVGSKSKKQAAA